MRFSTIIILHNIAQFYNIPTLRLLLGDPEAPLHSTLLYLTLLHHAVLTHHWDCYWETRRPLCPSAHLQPVPTDTNQLETAHLHISQSSKCTRLILGISVLRIASHRATHVSVNPLSSMQNYFVQHTSVLTHTNQ